MRNYSNLIFRTSTPRAYTIGQRWTDPDGGEWEIRKIIRVAGTGTCLVYGIPLEPVPA